MAKRGAPFGPPGVTKVREGKYRVRIYYNKQPLHGGYYTNAEAALSKLAELRRTRTDEVTEAERQLHWFLYRRPPPR